MKRESWKKLWPFTKVGQETITDLRVVGDLTVLRSKIMDDAEADYSWRIDSQLAKLDATRPVTLTFMEYLRYHRDDVSYPSPWSVRMAIDTLDGHHIGNCMYYDINPDKSQCEFGIMIGDREYWGRGYGTDAVKSALEHIFTDTQLERVYLHTLTDNLRAQKSFAKAGFSVVREVKRDGYKFVLMEIKQQDWAATQAEQKPKIEDEVLESASPSSASQATSRSRSSATQHQTEADPLPGA
ncbi:MAG: GNAT family N-acetyltransferase [Chloroflexi bacterium]|nr:GNAT family N-acetyltransferase [Chloroflexota bacterium]